MTHAVQSLVSTVLTDIEGDGDPTRWKWLEEARMDRRTS